MTNFPVWWVLKQLISSVGYKCMNTRQGDPRSSGKIHKFDQCIRTDFCSFREFCEHESSFLPHLPCCFPLKNCASKAETAKQNVYKITKKYSSIQDSHSDSDQAIFTFSQTSSLSSKLLIKCKWSWYLVADLLPPYIRWLALVDPCCILVGLSWQHQQQSSNH